MTGMVYTEDIGCGIRKMCGCLLCTQQANLENFRFCGVSKDGKFVTLVAWNEQISHNSISLFYVKQ
jgi:hypothetical protein